MSSSSFESGNGDFLQSEMWGRFQEAVGHKTLRIEGGELHGLGIIHELPLVGKYVYFPRGPILKQEISNFQFPISKLAEELQSLAKKENARWVRVEPKTEEELVLYREAFGTALCKAPHDVQPREILVMDITAEEEALLQKMKSKTRYNIRLAEKKGVKVFTTREKKYETAFLDLMKRTATRKEITPHPMSHYAHFFSSLPQENLFLFVAEYDNQVLAANVVVLSGETATYLHGGSSDAHREVMAPYLLQWEQIRFARKKGMKRYDFGGVRTENKEQKTVNRKSDWGGITRFKQGFAPDTQPFLFPGTYDIVLDPLRYRLYESLSAVRSGVSALRKIF